MSRVLLFGASGKVGTELVAALGSQILWKPRRIDIDLKHPFIVGNMIRSYRPDIVINAAAFNGMEAVAKDPSTAFIVNAAAPAAMAQACRDINALFIHYSTDYVFGAANSRLPEEEQDRSALTELMPIDPIGDYGWSKAAGEEAVRRAGDLYLIFRLQTLYGRSYTGPLDPIKQVDQCAGAQSKPVKYLHQFCAPTSARLVAEATAHVVRTLSPARWKEVVGLYHIATSKGVWRKDFVEWTIAEVHGNLPRYYARFELPYPRPIYSCLSVKKFESTFDFRLPVWERDFSLTFGETAKAD
jgi:dTDP-4-dehydrorhamnose reductase